MVASFGERLKREREKRGMTLEDVAGVTKISVRNLRALEQEKFDQMPGGIFNRGFVRSYAKHLGLDDEQVVADYMEAAGETVPSVTAPDAPAIREDALEKSAKSTDGSESANTAQVPWAALIGLLVLGTLLLVFWSYRSHHKNPESAPSTGQAPNVENHLDAAAQNPAQNVVPEPVSEPVSTTAPVATASMNTQQAASAASSTDNSAAVAPASITGFDVIVHARDEVWVSTAEDGKPPAEITMEDGQSVTVHASERAIVRVGNAAAVDVVFKGQKVLVHGAEGEVRTMVFTSAGLQARVPDAAKPN